MTSNVVAFKADTTDQDACISILEKALEDAKAGKMVDVAVIAAVNLGEGPEMSIAYWGEGNYACLVAGVSAIQFDLHHQRYLEAEG